MAWSEAESERIELVEKILMKAQKAIKNLAPKEMLNRLILLRNSDIETLQTRVEALEAAVQLLQNS